MVLLSARSKALKNQWFYCVFVQQCQTAIGVAVLSIRSNKKQLVLSRFRPHMFKHTVALILCLCKHVETPLVLLCFRSWFGQTQATNMGNEQEQRKRATKTSNENGQRKRARGNENRPRAAKTGNGQRAPKTGNENGERATDPGDGFHPLAWRYDEEPLQTSC